MYFNPEDILTIHRNTCALSAEKKQFSDFADFQRHLHDACTVF